MTINLAKRKELRAQLLQFLLSIYPERITRESIFNTFYEYFPTEIIVQELAYLCDKKYIERKDITTPFGSMFEKVQNFRLTSVGKDLLEGSIVDETIFFRS